MFFFVIVLYKCKLEDSISYNSISNSLFINNSQCKLLIWDNSPNLQLVPTQTDVWTSIQYYHCPENKGLGIAYNYAYECAKKIDFEWIGLLDQDTNFSTDYILKLKTAIDKNKEIKLFAPIVKLKSGLPFSPFKYIFKRGFPLSLTSGKYSLMKFSPINSGLVINTNSFAICGGYRLDVKLDFADVQFIERFRLYDSNFYIFDSVAIQDFSNDETDIIKLKNRFHIYCECAKNCDKKSISDYFAYFYTVSRHTAALVLRTRNLSFIQIMVKNYIL